MDPTLNQHVSTPAPNLIKYKNNIASADEVTIPLAPGKPQLLKVYTVPIDKILSVKNARAWVWMVSYLK